MANEFSGTLKDALQNALKQNEFVLFYQPEFNIETNQFVGVEALIRWHHPDKGLVLPHDFMQHVEDSDLVIPLGKWVIKTACLQNKAWQEKGLAPIRVAANVSEKQFLQTDFVSYVEKVLAETKLDPMYLELELSENMIIDTADKKAINAILELKKLGVQIALDDFGTGHSSISYLNKIPVDRIKIDRTYIRHIHANPEDAAIVRAIVTLALSLKLQVLAEGVETFKQLKTLMQQECQEAQGFYFSEPLSAEEVEKFLRFHQNNPFQHKN